MGELVTLKLNNLAASLTRQFEAKGLTSFKIGLPYNCKMLEADKDG